MAAQKQRNNSLILRYQVLSICIGHLDNLTIFEISEKRHVEEKHCLRLGDQNSGNNDVGIPINTVFCCPAPEDWIGYCGTLVSLLHGWPEHETHTSPWHPSRLTAVQKIIIAKSVGKRRQSMQKLATRLTAKGYPVSRETVRRYLKNDLGIRSYWWPKKPFPTQKMKVRRLQFAQERLHWSIDDWKRVVSSDKSYF